MKTLKFILLAVSCIYLTQTDAQNLNIIPEPFQAEKGTGIFQFPKSISINAPTSANELTEQIAKQLRMVTGKTVYFTKNEPNITLAIIKDDVIGNEGYTLNINAKGIIISANTNAGLFYGWQTVQQMMPAAIYTNKLQSNIQWQLPYVSIIDKSASIGLIPSCSNSSATNFQYCPARSNR
jgi:hexosaminidase